MTEWEPATEAEAAMRDALRDDDQELYFRILARTDLYLPMPPGGPTGGTSAGWGTWTTAGRTHVLAFTSEAALRACLADSAAVNGPAPFPELAGNWPNLEWWLAVNPGLPIEGYLPAWFVAQLARGDVRLPGRTLGSRARMERAEGAGRFGEASPPAAPIQREAPPDATASRPSARPESTSDWSAIRPAPAATNRDATNDDQVQPLREPPPFGQQRTSSRPVDPADPANRESWAEANRASRGPADLGPWRGSAREAPPPTGREAPPPTGRESWPEVDRGSTSTSDRPGWRVAEPESRSSETADPWSLLTDPIGRDSGRPPERADRRPTDGPRAPLTGWYAAAERSAGRSAASALEPTEVTRAQQPPAAPPGPAARPRPRIIEGAVVDSPTTDEPTRPADVPAAQGPTATHGPAATHRPATADAATRTTVPDPDSDTTVLNPRASTAAPDPDGQQTTVLNPEVQTTVLNPRSRPAAAEPDPEQTTDLGPEARTTALNPSGDTTVLNPHGETTVLDPNGETTVLDPAAERAAEPPLLGNQSGIGPTGGIGRGGAPGPAPAGPTDFRPANDVERTLFAAAGDGNTDTFLSTLLLARVLLPVAPDSAADSRPGEKGFVWRTEPIDGETYVVVFTSPERQAEHRLAEAATVGVKFVQLIGKWPSVDWSFAVNPGTPVGAKLPGEQIVALASWAAEVGLGVDEPVPEPEIAAPVPSAERAEPAASAAARDPNLPTMMQKAVAPSQVGFYLDRGYDRVSGFVQRAAELAHLRTPAALYAALGLHHAGSPFAAGADEIYLLRWPAHRPSLYRIPYGGQSEAAMRAMEGWVIERPPFRGNGFAPGEGRDVIAEFKVDSARLPHGAQLVRLTADGMEQLIATFDSDVPVWRKVDPA